ncbi:MAG: RHS repeat-associated core domain-containing protein, partial [Sulfurovaceae bacterium]
TFDATGKVEKVIDAVQGEWLFANTASSDANNYTIERASGDKLDYKESFLDNTGMLKTEEILPWGESIMYARSVHEETSSVEACGVTTVKTYKQESNGTLTKDPITDKKILDTITQSMPSGLTKSTTFTRNYEFSGDTLLKKSDTATINNTATFTTTKDYENATQTTLSAEGIQSIETFDANNDLLLSSQYGNLEPIHYAYDDKGRLLSTTQGDRTTTYAYDDRGNLISITDAKGKVSSYAYDQVDRLITITYPDNHTTHFGYDSNGNMTVLTTPHPTEHTFAYNGVNKRTSYTSPLQKATTYIYDKQRRVTQIIKPSGKSIATEYTNGRVESITTPEGVTSYAYNCGNNPATITKGSEAMSYTYDGTLLMALNQSGILNQTLEFSYDNNFNVTSFAYANGITNYLYNRDNRLIKSGNFTLSRDAQNSLVTQIKDDDYTQERKYNKYGELIKLEDGFFDYTLTRDKTKITKKREVTTEYRDLFKNFKWLKKFRWYKPIKIKQIKSLVNYRYVYDKRDRLIKVYKIGRVVEKYTYDPNGNRASATINGITTTASYTLDDQLVVYGNNTYAYDDDGYLSQKTTPDGVTSYTYGTLGELREVQTPTQTITYQHNALNQRVAKLIDGVIVEKYLWSDLTTLLAIYDGNDNLLQRFEYSDQRVPTAMTQGSNKYYLHYDQVGSLRAVSDTSGNIIKEITYDTYGNIISESNPTFKVPFGFAGGLYDRDTKLTRFGYRDYDAYTGKWTAKDPIDFAGGDTNLYGYVLGDPVNFVDPEGL